MTLILRVSVVTVSLWMARVQRSFVWWSVGVLKPADCKCIIKWQHDALTVCFLYSSTSPRHLNMKHRELRSYSCERTLTTLGFADAASVSPDGDFVLFAEVSLCQRNDEMIWNGCFHAFSCTLFVNFLLANPCANHPSTKCKGEQLAQRGCGCSGQRWPLGLPCLWILGSGSFL